MGMISSPRTHGPDRRLIWRCTGEISGAWISTIPSLYTFSMRRRRLSRSETSNQPTGDDRPRRGFLETRFSTAIRLRFRHTLLRASIRSRWGCTIPVMAGACRSPRVVCRWETASSWRDCTSMDRLTSVGRVRADPRRAFEKPKGEAFARSSRGTDPWLAFGFALAVLFAAGLRVARLHVIPPGLFFDEAANLFDVSDVLNGAHPLYFPRNNGREPFFFYWASLFASIWGPTPYAIRLAAAMVGTVTVVATFLCAREMLRGWADRVALVAAFVLSITYTHLHYSRIGLRSISLPLFLALSYGLLFRGLRLGSWWALVGAGIAGGGSLYTYISARIAPLPVLVVPLALGLPRRSLRPFWQTALVGLLWLTVSIPLGVYTIRHPGDVLGHTGDVSILNPVNNHGDPIGAVAHGIVATLAAFTFAGSGGADQNLPGRPILDPILSVLFVLGLGTLLVSASSSISSPGADRSPRVSSGELPAAAADRWSRLAIACFLIVWILGQSLPSALAVSPPGFIRM